MRITRITLYHVDLPLEHPYWLSGGRLKFEVLAATIPDHHLLGVWACQDMLTRDIAGGRGPRNVDGRLHLPETPGLGVHPDEESLGDPVAVYD